MAVLQCCWATTPKALKATAKGPDFLEETMSMGISSKESGPIFIEVGQRKGT